MKFKNDIGRSMMEMILYLGLIVVLTASTLKMYADSVEKTRLVEFETTIDEVKENVNNYFLGRQVPSDWNPFLNEVYKGSIYNPWGGNITLLKGEGESKINYGMQLTDLEQAVCIRVANAFIGKEAIAVNIDGTNLTDSNLNIGAVAGACKDDATVIGYFKKE